MMERGLASPKLANFFIDISWTELAKYVVATPETTQAMADLINRYPDRFLFGTDEVADVTGAGDTVAAAFTLARLAGGTFLEAAALANVAAGLVVMKRGTATVSPAELARAISSLVTSARLARSWSTSTRICVGRWNRLSPSQYRKPST